jgi:hypothetical protein
MQTRRSLSDILPRGDRERLQDAWDSTRAADDLGPLPAGEYRCRIMSGELFNARSGTAGFKVVFQVLDGEHAHRRVWYDVWLSPAALPLAKRDLAKIGVTHLDQLERPLPAGILATVRLALRRDDDGTERNRVVRFDPTGIEPAEPEPFTPIADTTDADGFDWTTGRQTEGTTP